jgi:hypothetical protein
MPFLFWLPMILFGGMCMFATSEIQNSTAVRKRVMPMRSGSSASGRISECGGSRHAR